LKRENGDRFRKMLLSRGGSEDAVGQFRNFTGGGDPQIGPLLERRGLTGEAPADAKQDIPPEPKK
jgi:peptidyl-dipeptidase Dcp